MFGRSCLWLLLTGAVGTLLGASGASGQNVPTEDTWQVPRTPDGRPAAAVTAARLNPVGRALLLYRSVLTLSHPLPKERA